MIEKNKINELFKTIDSMNPDKFITFLTDDAKFKFGNAPAVVGKAAIRETVANFFSTIKALSHKNTNLWVVSDTVIYEGEVSYTRHDNSTITIPFMNKLGMVNGFIKDYSIYIDVAPLYATASN